MSVHGGADAVLAASIFHFREHTDRRGQGPDGCRGRDRAHSPDRVISALTTPKLHEIGLLAGRAYCRAMQSDALRIERRDAVTVLHLDDGKVNALTFDLIAEHQGRGRGR